VGSPLPREDRFDVQNDGRILQIRYVEEKDRGVYTCRAINDVATIEASAELIILTQCKSKLFFLYFPTMYRYCIYKCIYIYYTLRFYFPYLSLLAQPVNITLYGPGLDCLVFDSVPERYLHYYFR
jgi:hypothetical protein